MSNQQRESIKTLLSNTFIKHPKWCDLAQDKQSNIINRIERECVNKTVKSCMNDGIPCVWNGAMFIARYSSECYKILLHIDSPEYKTTLVDKLISGEIDGVDLPNMTSHELCPESSKEILLRIEMRKDQSIEQKVSKAHYCKKCGGNETTMNKYQGCAADEDVNISLKCIQCNHIWRK